MKYNLLYKVVALIFILAIISCENDQSVRYHFTNLDLTPVNTSAGLPKTCGDSVPAAVFGIRLYLFPQETYRQGRYFDPYESGVNNSNPITKITITSDSAFNSEPPGSTLNHYFIHFPGNYLHIEHLEESGTIHPTARYYSNYEDVNYPEYTDVLLYKTISVPSSNKFYIRLDLYNGGAFIDSTQTIYLY